MVAVALAMVFLACLLFAGLAWMTLDLLRQERDRHDRVVADILQRVKAHEADPPVARRHDIRAVGSAVSREGEIDRARQASQL